VDRGRRNLDTCYLVIDMIAANRALCVPGNHDDKFLRLLKGEPVEINPGLEHSRDEVEARPAETSEATINALIHFFESLPSHYILDGGKLVVAHGGMKASLQGKNTDEARDFAVFGALTGQTDVWGLPERYNWAATYNGTPMVVYGHTPVPEAVWLNHTINIAVTGDLDTSCVFGIALTALRYPDEVGVSVCPGPTGLRDPSPPHSPHADTLKSQCHTIQISHFYIQKCSVQTGRCSAERCSCSKEGYRSEHRP
jgi:protein phosphatase